MPMEDTREDGEDTKPVDDESGDRAMSEAADDDCRRSPSVPLPGSAPDSASSSGHNRPDKGSLALEWLQHFLSSAGKFHRKEGCRCHKHEQDGKFLTKLLLSYYCTTCKEGPLCQYGKEKKHAGHSILRTKVLSGRICVELANIMEAVGGCLSFSHTQTYVTNGKVVVCLKSKRTTVAVVAPKSTKHRCVECLESISRKDDSKAVKFCSLDCKIEYGKRNPGENVWQDSLPAGAQVPAAQGEKKVFTKQGEKKVPAAQGEKKVFAEQGEKNVLAEQGEKKVLGEQGEKKVRAEQGEKNVLAEQGEKNVLAEQGEKNVLAKQGEKNVLAEQGEKNLLAEQGEENLLAEQGEENLLAEQGEENLLAEQGEKNVLAEHGEKKVRAEQGEKKVLAAVGEAKIPGGKQQNGKRKRKQVEEKVVKEKNGRKRKQPGGEAKDHRNGSTADSTRAFLDEPLTLRNLDMKLKTFDVHTPSGMLLDEALNQIRSCNWKVESCEDSVVEEELTKRMDIGKMYQGIVEAGDADGKQSARYSRAYLSSKTMDIFHVNVDSKSFSVLLPYEVLVANMISAMVEDFWVVHRS